MAVGFGVAVGLGVAVGAGVGDAVGFGEGVGVGVGVLDFEIVNLTGPASPSLNKNVIV